MKVENTTQFSMNFKSFLLLVKFLQIPPSDFKKFFINFFKFVIAVGSVRGCLLIGAGQKVYVFKMMDDDSNGLISGLAFVDFGTFIFRIQSFKTYALVTDLAKGLYVLRFQELPHVNCLSVVASEKFNAIETMSADLIVSEKHVGFVEFDRNYNITIFTYAATGQRDTAGAIRLVKSADARLPYHISHSFRLVTKAQKQQSFYKRQCTYYASQTGALGIICPIDEIQFKRLEMLQNFFTSQFWQPGGIGEKLKILFYLKIEYSFTR